MRLGLLALGAGLVLAALSELAFYPLGDVSGPGLVAFYALFALPALVAGLWTAPGPLRLFLCAAIFGFLAEGLVVPVLYEAPPLPVLWTSLAWHAALSAGLGLWAWRWAMASGGIGAAAVNAGLGALLGLWGAWSWPVLGADVAAPAGYGAQIWIAAGLFAAGQVAIGLGRDAEAPRWLGWGCAGAVLAVWAAGYGVALLPVSLLLPALLGLSLAALGRGSTGTAMADWLALSIPTARYAAVPLLPLAAMAVKAMAAPHAIGWELNALWAICFGALGGALWTWGLLRGLAGR